MTEDGQHWTPLLASRAVTQAPQRVVVAGIGLVVWRAGRRRPVVFLDRCPHHGLRLSTGHRTLIGRLVCDGHGWAFDASGVCRHAPGRPLAQTAGRRAGVVPCQERDGQLWVLTDADGVPVSN